MGWVDNVLDGDEGSAEKVRANARVTILLAWVAVAIMLGAVLVGAVLSLALDVDLGDLWGRFLPLIILMVLLQSTVLERYRRKRLEERVAALEGQARAPAKDGR